MPAVPKRFKWFATAQIGETKAFPRSSVTADGDSVPLTRSLLASARSYYQLKYPGRRFVIRTTELGWVAERLPDYSELPRGRPPKDDFVDRARLETAALRMKNFRTTKLARFAYAVSPEGASDPSPDVKMYRQRSAFQIQNTAATVLDEWRVNGEPNPWRRPLRAADISEIHPKRLRAANYVAAYMKKESGQDFEVEVQELNNFNGACRYIITLGDQSGVRHTYGPELLPVVPVDDLLAMFDDQPDAN